MKVLFNKSIGRFRKGNSYVIKPALGNFYVRANIASIDDYEAKVIPQPVIADDRDALMKEAKARGIKVHHKAGIETIKKALQGE